MKILVTSLFTLAFVTFVSNSPTVLAQPDDPAFCPNTTTDTDGDGWGTENGQPCRVLRNTNAYPVCSSVEEFTDSDFDGWGWQDDATCLVDNTTVEKNFTVTDSNGTATTAQVIAPLVAYYVEPLGNFPSAMVISSESILYHYRVPNRELAATDNNGTTLWTLKLYNDFINELVLDESEETLYALTGPEGRVAAYSTDGVQIWRSDDTGFSQIGLTKNAIIVGKSNDFSTSHAETIISLNLDGTQRWKFEPGGSAYPIEVGRDNKIYVKILSEPYGNESTFVLEE